VTDKKLHSAVSILIVDDSEDDVEASRRAFKQAGLETPLQHLLSGEEALDYLKSPPAPRPSLILLDLNMPGIGGRKTLEILKQDKDLRDIPVVVLTSSTYDEDVRICYALGANTFINKPVSFEVFAKAIRMLKEYWFDTALLPPSVAGGAK
jgi:two-component system response regulator